MSYILEAIRKSEALRKKKSHRQPIRLLHAKQQKQTPWGTWLLAALVTLVVINIATLGYFSQHGAQKSAKTTGISAGQSEPVTIPALSRQTGSKSSAPASVQGGASQPEKPLAFRHAHPETEGKRARTTSLPFPSASNPSFAQEGGKRASLPSAQALGVKLETPPLPSARDAPNDNIPHVVRPPEPDVAVPNDPSRSPVSKEIPLFSELPSELRQRIPPIKVNVHAYSQLPQEQFIIVSMVKYRPGEQIGNELVLEDVTREGLVLRFQDQPFRLLRP